VVVVVVVVVVEEEEEDDTIGQWGLHDYLEEDFLSHPVTPIPPLPPLSLPTISLSRRSSNCSTPFFSLAFSQNVPIYTLTTSGVLSTLPMDHINAP